MHHLTPATIRKQISSAAAAVQEEVFSGSEVNTVGIVNLKLYAFCFQQRFCFSLEMKNWGKGFPFGLPLRFSLGVIVDHPSPWCRRRKRISCLGMSVSSVDRGRKRRGPDFRKRQHSKPTVSVSLVKPKTKNMVESAPMQILNLPRDFYCPERSKINEVHKIIIRYGILFGNVTFFFLPHQILL